MAAQQAWVDAENWPVASGISSVQQFVDMTNVVIPGVGHTCRADAVFATRVGRTCIDKNLTATSRIAGITLARVAARLFLETFAVFARAWRTECVGEVGANCFSIFGGGTFGAWATFAIGRRSCTHSSK